MPLMKSNFPLISYEKDEWESVLSQNVNVKWRFSLNRAVGIPSDTPTKKKNKTDEKISAVRKIETTKNRSEIVKKRILLLVF